MISNDNGRTTINFDHYGSVLKLRSPASPSPGTMNLREFSSRSIAQTKMSISQRAEVHGVAVDVLCVGRFYDFFEKRDGHWKIVRRRLTYEKDRMDPLDPSATLKLDPALLAKFPEGYRHLGYLQTSIGFKVKDGLPGLRGPSVEKLYAEGKAWLAGSPTPGEALGSGL